MSTIIHDVAKILYSREGYLPDYPYHLISDKEMFDAFINNDANYFTDNYPCPNEDFQEKYDNIIEQIRYHIDKYLEDNTYEIPIWLYSYMVGGVISINSDERDRQEYIELLGLPGNPGSTFNDDVYNATYHVSETILTKSSSALTHRPATIFGEPDIVKELKIYQAIQGD